MKDRIIDKASNLNASSHASHNDFISQRIDKLLRGQNNTQASDALDLANNYLNILSTHHEEDLGSPISQAEVISKKFDDIKLLEILLSLSHAEPATESQKTTIKDMVKDLANLVIAKVPNASSVEHLETLDSLFDFKKESHNAFLNDRLQELELDYSNEHFAYKHGDPDASPLKLQQLAEEIATLISRMI